jgi:signal transduction histidine kinase
MKKPASAEECSASVAKRGWHYGRIIGQIVLIITFGLLGILVPRKDESLAFVFCLLSLLAPLIGTSWAWMTVHHARSGPMPMPIRYQCAWFLIGLAVLTSGLSRAYVTYLDALGQGIPVPSVADIGFTLFYPLVFAGLVFMVTDLRPQRTCIRMGLDACITSLCLLSVSWFALLAPAVERLSGVHVATVSLLTVLSYPFWGLFLMIALLMILERCAERVLHVSILFCGAGLLMAMGADTASASSLLVGSSHTDPVSWNALWFMTYLLMGLCACAHSTALTGGTNRESLTFHSRTTQPESTPSLPRLYLVQSTLLFLPLSLLFALTLVSELMHDTTRALFLVIVSAVVGLLVVTRLWLTTYENTILLQEQQQQKSELESLYQQKQSAYARLQEANQRKDLFILTTSHEVRTPLTAIKSYFEVMRQYGGGLSPEQQQNFLQQAAQRCDDLVALLEQMLRISHLEAESQHLQIQRVSVEALLDSIVELLGPQLRREEREISLCIQPHLFVQADPSALRQILLNLGTNALKYSEAGTPLTFIARQATEPSPCVLISVKDQGLGIPPHEQGHLFQRFIRLERDLHSAIRGAGLGLYIARSLVEAMQGRMWVESSGIVGEGSTFHVAMPLP